MTFSLSFFHNMEKPNNEKKTKKNHATQYTHTLLMIDVLRIENPMEHQKHAIDVCVCVSNRVCLCVGEKNEM